jgi:hypothetical protein
MKVWPLCSNKKKHRNRAAINRLKKTVRIRMFMRSKRGLGVAIMDGLSERGVSYL